MTQLQQVLATWRRSDFADVLKQTVAGLGSELPLQAGLSAGSYALEEPLDVLVIRTSETADCIAVKVGIFYESLTPGCAGAGDPTIESEQNEHITVLVSTNKKSSETTFQLLED